MTNLDKRVDVQNLFEKESINLSTIRGKKHNFNSDEEKDRYVLGTDHFNESMQQAYSSQEGFAMYNDPITGEEELIIAGTRKPSQWGLNLLDGITYGAEHMYGNETRKYIDDQLFSGIPLYQQIPHVGIHLDPSRKSKQYWFEDLSDRFAVDVAYGHSRGGAIVADMRNDSVRKVGVDAAMIIAENKDMVNYNQANVFDQFIGITGKNNRIYGTNKKFHHAYVK